MSDYGGIALAIASAVGTAVNALGEFQRGQAESAESDFRAQVARNNALIAEQNAQAELERGKADVRDQRRLIQQRIGSQRAQLAAQGFDVAEGSSIEILADTAVLGELDVLRIRADAENRARNLRQQAQDFRTESTLNAFAAKRAKQAGAIGAAGTLLTGAGRVGPSFLK